MGYSKNLWPKEKERKKEHNIPKKYSFVLGYEDLGEPWASDHHSLMLTLEHWRTRFVQCTHLKNQSRTPLLQWCGFLNHWAHVMSLWPFASAGALLSKQTISSYLTSLYDHFLMRERVSETFVENPWFLKTWLEWSVTDSFSYWGGQSLCPSNSSHNARRLSPWKLIAYLPGGRRRKAGFRVSDVSGICGVSSRR